MAPCRHVVFLLGAGVGQADLPPHHPRYHFPGRADRRDAGGHQSARRQQRLDHAHQGPHRHAHQRHSHPGGLEDHRRRSAEDRRDRRSRSRPRCMPCRERAEFSPSAPTRATSSMSYGSATSLRNTASAWSRRRDTLDNAIGGDNVSTVYQGTERYPVNVRYMRDFRSSWMPWAGCWYRRAERIRRRSANLPTSRCAADPR